MSSAGTEQIVRKRSFLRLPVDIDVDRLTKDYQAIPADAWASTHWDIHCSSNMVLLRGGNQGNEDDFSGTDQIDHAVLKKLPYISWLIGESGPFGGTNYAFILRMKPLGVARPHIDDNPAWAEPFRVHVPIITNDKAYLLSEGRSKHLSVGEVWTFDNQVEHAVTNGDAVRTHLIFDVSRGPKLLELLERAEFDPGEEDPDSWRTAGLPDKVPTLPYGVSEPISFQEKKSLGLSTDSFASRIVETHRIARLTRADLKVGDIVYEVNGVSECAVARTITDYIQVRHRPGQVLTLQIIRGDERRTSRIRLFGTRNVNRLLAVKHRLTGRAKAAES
jgi:Aspartyl/Asparaginyl beta-hydroxylase